MRNDMIDIDGLRDGWAVSRENDNCMLRSLPPTQPDTYEALRILDAINSSGRLDYGDYCDLHDAISAIGAAQNG